MALTPLEVKAVLKTAMETHIAEALLDGNFPEMHKRRLVQTVAERFDEEQIERILVEMFKELSEELDRVIEQGG
jgi:hypothetical protein